MSPQARKRMAFGLKTVSVLTLVCALLMFLGGSTGVALGEVDPSNLRAGIFRALAIAVLAWGLSWLIARKAGEPEERPLSAGSSVLRAFCLLGALFFGLLGLSFLGPLFYEKIGDRIGFLIFFLVASLVCGAISYLLAAKYRKLGRRPQ